MLTSSTWLAMSFCAISCSASDKDSRARNSRPPVRSPEHRETKPPSPSSPTPTTGSRTNPSHNLVAVLRIRNAKANEAPALEALQHRSSDVWKAYREQLAANPDAIELPERFVTERWVRVAVDLEDRPLGFSVVIPTTRHVHELDGLFVEPDQMSRGVGRALITDAADRARAQGADALEVTAGPAQGFYERVGFDLIGVAQTRFGPAVRLRRELGC